MSIREREWTTAKGEVKTAWVATYTDGSGKRRIKTFSRKKDADAFHDRTKVDVRDGIHTPDAASITIADAAAKWLTTSKDAGLERSTLESYENSVRHIVPFLGSAKLSKLSTPCIREFEDRLRREGRSPAMVKKILASLAALVGDGRERSLVARNVVRDLRSRRKTSFAASGGPTSISTGQGHREAR